MLLNSQSIPVGGIGRNIEQVLDVQVDLPSTRALRATMLCCAAARSRLTSWAGRSEAALDALKMVNTIVGTELSRCKR